MDRGHSRTRCNATRFLKAACVPVGYSVWRARLRMQAGVTSPSKLNTQTLNTPPGPSTSTPPATRSQPGPAPGLNDHDDAAIRSCRGWASGQVSETSGKPGYGQPSRGAGPGIGLTTFNPVD
eukprot:3047290-Rhodomonas_salina.2